MRTDGDKSSGCNHVEDSEPSPHAIPAFGHLPLDTVIAAHPMVVQSLATCDPVHTASLFAGMLTLPELQSNCCRLEALAHLALSCGAGSRKPTSRAVATWFDEMSAGPCGLIEDPAEDAFTSLVTTRRGNFRIIEGVWESAAFFLQRIVNVVDRMPGNDAWLDLRETVYAFLKLSDLVCERSGLGRYIFGNPRPELRLAKSIERLMPTLRQRVTFTKDELEQQGISLNALDPYVFHPDLRRRIPESSLTHSPLIHHPLLYRDDQITVALPAAASIAIRCQVAGGLVAAGLRDEFLAALAHEYEEYFSENPPLGIGRRASIQFLPTDNGVMAYCAKEVDAGRYLNLIFVLDTLEGFEESAFAGANPDPKALAGDFDRVIDSCVRMAEDRGNLHQGLTLIIGCGIGRATYHVLSGKRRERWRTVYLSAPDVASLSDLDHIDARTFLRILDGEDRLLEQGVELCNVNGFMNLVAWVRSLGGHLIEHGQVPVEWGTGGRCRLLVDTAMVRELRQEVAERIDRHAVLSPDGEWSIVRKTGDSLFAEDRVAPLYVSTTWFDRCGLAMVYEGQLRSWWCEVTQFREYHRWKIMSTWLPRLAATLDRDLPNLPTSPLLLRINFDGYDGVPVGETSIGNRAEIEQGMRVEVDADNKVISVETGRLFERGLAHPTNVSEAALIAAIVRGCIELTGAAADPGEVDALVIKIVRNEDARDCHLFQASHFRDFVRDASKGSPIRIDTIDDATLRLGLGWRVRERDEGGEIHGKIACTKYLNSLVAAVENELCADLRALDRRSVVEIALQNHEAAMIEQGRWRRTAGAILSLYDDKAAARATINEHEFENNAVLQASRVLVELAVCECALEGGRIPGEMDLSKLMAQLLLATTLGDWSDAIHLDEMKASVWITPLGDVQVASSFLDEIVKPFGELASESMLNSSIADYPSNFKGPRIVAAAQPAFEDGFIAAWRDERLVGLDDYRRFADDVENFGIKENRAVVQLRKSALLSLYTGTPDAAAMIVESLTTKPRVSWRTIPTGFTDKDRRPWRFRRRFSLLRLPIVQIDEVEDPMFVLAPGLVRDAVSYTVRNYYEGYLPDEQLATPAMKSWKGKAANKRGNRFAVAVAERLREYGWNAETEVQVTTIVKKRLGRDFGDVDVLAWDMAGGRVLLIECKDLHFHKTAGELAEQLRDFRGEIRDGRRDDLRKHLDRCDILRERVEAVAAYVGLAQAISIEGWVIFRNPVPMLLAWDDVRGQLRMSTFDQLDQI